MSLTIDIANTLVSVNKKVDAGRVDSLLRNIAQGLLGEIRTRIHEQGEDAKGKTLGNYSTEYLKKRIRSGKTSSKKVILSFTRQMQNDFKVISQKGSYGLGFNNSLNADKARWAEERYGKIYALTNEEQSLMRAIINDWIKGIQ